MGRSKDLFDRIYETWLGGKDEEQSPEPEPREVHVHLHFGESDSGEE